MLIFSACYGISKEAKIVHQLEREIFNEIYIKYGLISEGISKEGPKYNLKMCERVGMILGSYRVIDKDEGRKILFEISDTFLKKINGHAELKSYMTNWPVTEKNVDVSIVVHDVPGKEWNPNNVKFFFLSGRGIRFSYNIPNDSSHMRNERETLEEARAKLNQG